MVFLCYNECMNIYLITSDSYKLIDKEIEKIISSSSNVIKYDLRVNTLNDVVNEANYFSFDDTKKYIIVRCDNMFKTSKKDEEEESSSLDTKILEKYLDNPSNNSILILVSMTSPDKRRKIYKLLKEKSNIIEIPILDKKSMTYKCMEILKKEGYLLDYETANYIVENSYLNYDIMLSEIDKIKFLVKKGYITKKDLYNVVAESLNGNIYTFINLVLNNKLEEAFFSKKDFDTLKIDPIVVFISLAKEVQLLYLVKTHNNLREIMNYYHKEDWQMENYIKNANNYSEKELKKIIIKLCDYDYKIKSGKINKDYILDLVAFDLCS